MTNGRRGATTPDGPWLAVIGTAAAAMLVLVGLVIGLTWLFTGSWIWDYQAPTGAPDPEFSVPGALRSALLIVGGFGGVVALVVAYRRQKLLEINAAGAREAARDANAAGQAREAGAREAARDANAAEQAREAGGRDQVRLFTERFGAASAQLGSTSAVTRLAGVYAMASVADEWEPQRQQCIDVLCAYMRLPYTSETTPVGSGAPVRTTIVTALTGDGPEHRQETTTESRPGEHEVRLTITRVIRDHLTGDDPLWASRDFDFTGATFDGADFRAAKFSGGTVNFRGATFTGGTVNFRGATFTGGTADFSLATFSGGTADFSLARFSGGTVDFSLARFSGGTVDFRLARFSGGTVNFTWARFSGGTVNFIWARFSGGTVNFDDATFSGGTVNFDGATFSGGTVNFGPAGFSGTLFAWPDGSIHEGPPPVS